MVGGQKEQELPAKIGARVRILQELADVEPCLMGSKLLTMGKTSVSAFAS